MAETLMPRNTYSGDFDGTWRLYRASLRHSLVPAALLALMWAMLLAQLMRRFDALAQDDVWLLVSQAEQLLAASALWWVLAGACGVSTFLFCMLTAIVHGVAVEVPIGFGTVFARALRTFPGALVAAAIYVALTTIGSLFLFVPGAWLWGMWQLWPVALVAEGAGPTAALGRSWLLMRGVWWPATTLTTVVTLVAIAIPLACNGMAGTVAALAGMSVLQAQHAALLAWGVSAALTAPLLPAALVAVYVAQLRGRAGGV
ncbi:MAG: hypothetical protein ACRES2_02700 [Steroidobacteraceae bacterium]